MKTSLGIWALGSMVTRFVPGGYQPQWAGETTAERVRRAIDGLGRPHRRLRVPLPAGAQRRRTSTRCARRSASTTSTAWRRASTSIPRFGKGGLVVAGRRHASRSREADPRRGRLLRRARRALHHLARGSRATTTRSRRRTPRAGPGSSTGSGRPRSGARSTESCSSSSTRTPSRR